MDRFTFRDRLLFKLYGLTMGGESLRWIPVRRWIFDRLLHRKHRGLAIHAHVYITGWWALQFGDHVTINRDCVLLAEGGLTIGDHSMIAHACSVVTGEHGTALGRPMSEQPVVHRPVRIGKDVWLGARVIVLGGSEIADGTVVAAGAVVKGRFAKPEWIIGGVPAKPIRRRGGEPD